MLLTMSISGGILIILIIVLRFFAINKLPKKVFVLLWDIVLLRLLIPFNLPISYGIASPAAKMIDNGIILYNVSYPPITQGNTKKLIVETANITQSSATWVTIAYLTGIITLLVIFGTLYLYCSSGRSVGTEKKGTIWLIPQDTEKRWTEKGLLYKEKTNMIDVYYAEDDEMIAQSVKEYLEQQNCKVTVFRTINDIRKALRCHLPSILLLDWNMPDGQGNELCRLVREKWTDLPIIFLTVRGNSHDIITGFQNGTDDYVVKPFELTILYSRMLALLRRTGKTKETKLFCDNLTLDKEKMAVYYEQEEIQVSQPEYQLLLLLMENKGKTITRQQLLEQIWDSSGNYVNDNTLTVTMKRLREKLHNPPCLKTIRSFGYRMEDSV